jgi:hypothetical protein
MPPIALHAASLRRWPGQQSTSPGRRCPHAQRRDRRRRGLCSSLLRRRSQRHTEFRCLLIGSSHAPLQSASDYRGICLLSCEGFECTDVLFPLLSNPAASPFALPSFCSLQTCGPISAARRTEMSHDWGLTRPKRPNRHLITSALPDAAQSDRVGNGSPPCNVGR